MVSTGWGGPNTVKKGFHATDVMKGDYGFSVNLFRWSTHEKIQTIELPELGGPMPFEIRFKHDPNSPYAFFGSVLGSCLWLLKPESEGSQQYTAECAVKIPSIEV
ncbi:unnamed protein product [Cylicostephanus goldi]|uniref:Uncharacterized protein n=1 Tax=Cylicostephanus goldi TaxID=71465 RepID=A0A3P6T6A7_CYLGO|nr:unnamed protein product [Cylicostephanus goldi]